ncbi:MAG: hypothetical protein U0559_05325 [Anaerolineae bacterium]
MLSLMRLLLAAGRITRGEVLFDGIDLLGISERQMRHHRWKEMAMVFQSAMNALNPVRKVGDQIRKDFAARLDGSLCADRRVEELLDLSASPSRARSNILTSIRADARSAP